MDADGYIRIAGRSRDIIIRGGENIPVVEVENLLFKHPAVAEVSVVGYPDERLGERACAFVVPRPGQAPTLADLVGFLRAQQVAPQYMPERLELLDAMPATPSAAICAAICGTPISPSGVWPPVMATALLTRILKVMVALAATAAPFM